jgi:hypothetical protein
VRAIAALGHVAVACRSAALGVGIDHGIGRALRARAIANLGRVARTFGGSADRILVLGAGTGVVAAGLQTWLTDLARLEHAVAANG